MTIDPRIGMWLSIALATIAFLTTAGAELTTIFGQVTANDILAGCGLLMGLGNALNAVLHAIPSQSGAAGAAEFPLGPKK